MTGSWSGLVAGDATGDGNGLGAIGLQLTDHLDSPGSLTLHGEGNGNFGIGVQVFSSAEITAVTPIIVTGDGE